MKIAFNKFIKENKQTLIGVLIVLVVFGFIKYTRHNELKKHGIIVEGRIIECDMLKINGACVVTIEYKTTEGILKTSVNTLYGKQNCEVGKVVNVEYSTESDLTNIIE